jgi:hypothetical protein
VLPVTWTWKYQLSTATAWTDLLSTQHRIYTLLNDPTAPWAFLRVGVTNPYYPWTEALDLACTWARGATASIQAARMITSAINTLSGFSYEAATGGGVYTAPNPFGISFFNLTGFLRFANGVTPNPGGVVNCCDCATIVTTFANVIGCDLTETLLAPARGSTLTSFTCNKIITLNSTAGWAYPFPPANAFSYHEVAVPNPMLPSVIFDACLKVDSGDNPWDWTNPTVTHTAVLPAGMDFDMTTPPTAFPIATPFTDQTYRERLAQNTVAGIGACDWIGSRVNTMSGRRPLY